MIPIHADKEELNFPHSPEVLRALNSCPEEIARRYQKEPTLIDRISEAHPFSEKRNFPKERIFLDQGVMRIIHRIFDYRLRPGSMILLPELGYPKYFDAARATGAKIETFSFIDQGDRFSYNLDDLLEKLEHKPAIAVITDPESPLGFSLPEVALEKILSKADSDTLVVLDQAHEGFRLKHEKDVGRLATYGIPNLIIARSFSKFYGLAGTRIGYALCGESAKKMINFREIYLGFDGLAQHLAEAALRSKGNYMDNAQKIREEKAKFNKLVRGLPGYRALETDHASAVVQVPREQSDFLVRQAKAAQIEFRHLGEYHPKLKDWYRITMAPPEQMDRVIDLFESVSWLYDLNVHNSDAPSIIHTRDAGYTVHRREIPYKKSGILMGTHRVLVPPGKNVPAHLHPNQDELFEFHSDAYVDINGKPFKVRSGDCVIVQAGEAHIVEALPDRFGRFVAFRFPYEHTDKYDQTGKQVIHERPPTEIK